MNRTKIIEHYKEFMQIDEMTEDYQIDIDWVEALIDDYNLVNKNDICQNVGHRYFVVGFKANLPEGNATGSINIETKGKYLSRAEATQFIKDQGGNAENIVITNVTELSKDDYTEWVRAL